MENQMDGDYFAIKGLFGSVFIKLFNFSIVGIFFFFCKILKFVRFLKFLITLLF